MRDLNIALPNLHDEEAQRQMQKIQLTGSDMTSGRSGV